MSLVTGIITIISTLTTAIITAFVTVKIKDATQDEKLKNIERRVDTIEEKYVSSEVFLQHQVNDTDRLNRIEGKLDMLIKKLIK